MTTMTTNDTMTADEAQRLLDGREAKGRWRSGSVEREGKVWAHDPDALGGHGVGEVCIFNANMHAPHNGNRALCAAAPKLAASVVALHAQFAQVTAERDALRARAELAEAERADALSELTRVTRERDALRVEREAFHNGLRTALAKDRGEPIDLDAIEARARATGVDLWDVSCDVTDPHDQCAMVVLRSDHGVCVAPFLTRAAAEFISHAREDVPALVEEVRRLRAELAPLRSEFNAACLEAVAARYGRKAAESEEALDLVVNLATEVREIADAFGDALRERDEARRRIRDERVGEQWLEQDFTAPEGGNLTLSTEAVIGIVRHALDDVVPRIADRCDRLVVRYHVVGAVPDIDDGSVLIRADSGPEGMSSAVHPRLQALADANSEVERLRAIIKGRTTPPSDEEIAAHDGPWLVVLDHRAGHVSRVVCGDSAAELAAQQRAQCRAWVWHPFDERVGAIVACPVVGR